MPTLHPLLFATLLFFAAAGVEAQTQLPGDDRHGKAGTWDVGAKSYPEIDDEDSDSDPWESKRKKSLRMIKCHLRDIQELGRIYVQDVGGGNPYWIQLPDAVKIRAASKADFDGRKKLNLEDLEVGQRLELTLRKKDDEILVVRVRPS